MIVITIHECLPDFPTFTFPRTEIRTRGRFVLSSILILPENVKKTKRLVVYPDNNARGIPQGK